MNQTSVRTARHPNAPANAVPAPAKPPAQSRAPAEGSQLVSRLQSALTAGWLEGNMEPFLRLLADDALIVASRGPEPGPYDVTFSKEAYAALMRAQGAQPVRAVVSIGEPYVKFESVQIERNAQRVHVAHVRVFQGLSVTEKVHERFKFARTDERWLIVAVSYHPLSVLQFGTTSFDASRISELDAQAEQTHATPMDRAYALFTALRYVEAARIFCALAEAPKAPASSWLFCAHASLFAGDPVRARAAFLAAAEQDPLIVLP